MTTRLYTVHLGRDDGELKLVREGFNWPAFLFSVPWALWHRMWLVALIFAAAQGLLGGGLLLAGLGQVSQAAASLGLAVLIGYGADELRRNALERRGYTFEDVVCADSLDMAERRVLDARPEWLAGLGRSRP